MANTIQYGQYSIPGVDEMINFGVGQPAPSMLPLDKVREAAATKLAETDPLFLQYGYISGYPAFRECLARFLGECYGKLVDPSLLFVTNGISGALGLICSLFATRGDVIVVEEPSYFLAQSIFRDFGLSIVSVGMDDEGMRTGELAQKLAAGLRPKLVYTIPAFHNPTGACLSAARKAHLVQLAAEYGFTVLADEVYQSLAFDGVPPPPPILADYDTAGRVISMGSFAKILAPAMRLGWLQVSPAGKPLLDRIYNCGQLDSSGGLNPVMSGVVHAFIDAGHQRAHLAAVRAELTTRAATLGDALRKYLPPGAAFLQPTGGYFVWIRLPTGLRGSALLDLCLGGGFRVRFHPGTRFGGPALESHIRLSFSYYDAGDLAVGAERLGRAMLELGARVATALAKPVPAAGAGAFPAPAGPSPSGGTGAALAVAVHGAKGRLGSLVVAALGDPSAGGSVGCPGGFAYAGALDVRAAADGPLNTLGAHVVVDVSLPDGTAALANAMLLAARSTPGARPPALVVGTTGALPTDVLTAYAAVAPVVVSANFSVGVPLVLGLLGSIGAGVGGGLPAGWHAEVTETHHTAKRDAPSGTAKRIVHALHAAGVGGVDPAAPIPTHALRLGDTIGTHTVHLAGQGERVEITHTATRRDVFALGALRTAAWAATLPPGLYYK